MRGRKAATTVAAPLTAEGSNASIFGFAATISLVVAIVLAGAPAAFGAPKIVDRFFPLTSGSGTLGGQFNNPRGVTIRESTGQIYVADASNHRIQRFAANGSFERAWGSNVVGRDERQTVTVSATAGTYTLAFDGATTGPLAFNANATAVDTALGGLSSVGGAANVTVTGTAAGGFTVTFTGSLATPGLGGTNVPEMTANASGLTGGAATVTITTLENGTGGPGANFEICTTASLCRAGSATGGNAADNLNNGAMNVPQAIAINQVTGDVYVRDRGNQRVNQYTSDGTFVRSWGWDVDGTVAGATFEVCPASDRCKAGLGGTGDGQFGATTGDGTGIAINPSTGDVFVVDPGGPVSPNRRLQRFESDGDFIAKYGGVGPGLGLFGGAFAQPHHIAVSASGIVYVSDCDEATNVSQAQRYDLGSATWLSPIDTGNVGTCSVATRSNRGLAIDSDTGNLFVARPDPGDVREYDVSVEPPVLIDTHVQNIGILANGIAVSDGDLYLTSGTTNHRVYVADDDGATGPLDVTLNPPTGVTSNSASFSGSVNPGGFPTSYRFEVSTTGVDWTPVTTPNVSLGSGLTPVAVPVNPSEGNAATLEACALYRVRIAANRGFGNPDVFSPELAFATDCVAPSVTGVTVSSRGTTNAFVRADINPNNQATTYRIEYGPTADYGSVSPQPAASAGSGGIAQTVEQELASLTPDAEYHYRVIATNARGTTTGTDQTFRTRAVATSPSSSRAFELVSPALKSGGLGVGTWYVGPASAGTAGWASPTKERFAVQSHWGAQISDGAFAFTNDVMLAERTGAGWTQRPAITLPAQGGSHTAKSFTIVAAAPDLSLTQWHYPTGLISLFPETGAWGDGITTKYLRDWAGNWELLAPTDPSQMRPGLTDTGAEGRAGQTSISENGRYALTAGPHRGMLGAGDPTNVALSDLEIGPRTVYLADTAAGLTNGLPGNTSRELVNVCTGQGGGRTEIPSRLGTGKLTAATCPAPLAGRDARLITAKGAALGAEEYHDLRLGMLSRDGSRAFFMSPDPGQSVTVCSAATGDATSCPAQLYVRQRNTDGQVMTRWISRTEVTPANGAAADQDASLLSAATFEGATPDGDKVFFRTQTPLTADDPNGVKSGGAVVAPPAGGIVTGSASASSDDLFMYDLPDGPDGDPATPDADPAGGDLIRISGGSGGSSDCDVTPTASAALRFLAETGERLYFTCSAPLANAGLPDNGTVTSPAGSAGEFGATNVYVYDSTVPLDDRWKFVARLPRANDASSGTPTDLNSCATTGFKEDNPIVPADGQRGPGLQNNANCWNGSSDGRFATFFTGGALTADDPDATSGDLYGYEATTDTLTRLSAPQGGSGGGYHCVTLNNLAQLRDAPLECHGDNGYGALEGPLRRLGVVAQPDDLGDHIAFFQSASRLVPEDDDDGYDVYQWRNGSLSLVTSGAASSLDAMFMGTDRTGLNVYVATRERLSWQDVDSLLDVYTARVGGGFPQPTEPASCDVLGDVCQGGGFDPVSSDTKTPSSSESKNAKPEARKTLAVSSLSMKARRSASRTGRLSIAVRTSATGRVSLTVKAKMGKKARRVGRTSKRVKAGKTRLNLRLNSAARKHLRAGKKLLLTVEVRQPGARTRTMNILLPGVPS